MAAFMGKDVKKLKAKGGGKWKYMVRTFRSTIFLLDPCSSSSEIRFCSKPSSDSEDPSNNSVPCHEKSYWIRKLRSRSKIWSSILKSSHPTGLLSDGLAVTWKLTLYIGAFLCGTCGGLRMLIQMSSKKLKRRLLCKCTVLLYSSSCSFAP